MTEKNNNLSVLEEKHNISIMLFLYENGTCIKSQIYKGISMNSRMPDKLNMLENKGLVQIRTDNFSNNRAEVSLTEKGIEVAKHLQAINEIMDGKS